MIASREIYGFPIGARSMGVISLFEFLRRESFKLTICFVMLVLMQSHASAGGVIPIVQSSTNAGTQYFDTPEEGCSFQWNHYRSIGHLVDNATQRHLRPFIISWTRPSGGSGINTYSVLPYTTPYLGGWHCVSEYESTNPWTGQVSIQYWNLNWMYPVCPVSFAPGTYPLDNSANHPVTCPGAPNFYVIGRPGKNLAENGACLNGESVKVLCGDPINPAAGNTFNHVMDFSAPATSVTFDRFYNSKDDAASVLGSGWRGTYSRRVKANFYAAAYQPLSSSDAAVSSLYNDEAAACGSGFAQIQAQVPQWGGAAASFSSGVCHLTKNGVSVGTLPIYSAYGKNLATESAATSYDYVRDDGAVTRFSIINGVITPPPGTSLKISTSALGYQLTDGNDRVEQYDPNGKLLSITDRTGVVQVMSYDGSGRLSGVTDSLGYQLSFTYDAAGRLSSVTRQ